MENKKKGKFSKDTAISIISGILAVLLIATDIYILKTQGIESLVVAAILAFAAVIMLIICITTVIGERTGDKSGYEDVYKAQKASYLMIKENFTRLQEKMEQGGGDLPAANEIIEAQKAMAKVTINRSKENTDALINSNAELMDRISTLEGKISDNNTVIIKEQQSLLEETQREIIESNSGIEKKLEQVNEIVKGLQVNVANLEQTQRTLSMQQPVMMVQAMPMQQPMQMPNMSNIVNSPIQPMPPQQMPQPAPVSEPLTMNDKEPVSSPDLEPVDETGAASEQGLMSAESASAFEAAGEEILEETAAVPEETKIPEKGSEAAEVVPEIKPEPVLEQPAEAAAEIKSESAPEPVTESLPEPAPHPVPTSSEDPNKKLSPDEIAAMFAGNAAVEAEPVSEQPAEAAAENKPESASEPVTETIPEPAPQPVPASSEDPNKKLSPDEIAAMFAGNTAVEAEPVAEAEENPNKIMSPEEIEAMFAKM